MRLNLLTVLRFFAICASLANALNISPRPGKTRELQPQTFTEQSQESVANLIVAKASNITHRRYYRAHRRQLSTHSPTITHIRHGRANHTHHHGKVKHTHHHASKVGRQRLITMPAPVVLL